MYKLTWERGEWQQEKDLKRSNSKPIGRKGDKQETREKKSGELGRKEKGKGKMETKQNIYNHIREGNFGDVYTLSLYHFLHYAWTCIRLKEIPFVFW